MGRREVYVQLRDTPAGLYKVIVKAGRGWVSKTCGGDPFGPAARRN